jgi:hypothetical protein
LEVFFFSPTKPIILKALAMLISIQALGVNTSILSVELMISMNLMGHFVGPVFESILEQKLYTILYFYFLSKIRVF